MTMPRIFISYSRTDEDFARRLATSLSEMGADVWIDIEDIPAGLKWSSAIQEGLDSADLMIVIVSPESMASRNVEDEWQYYLDQRKQIIPVLLKPARVHFQLNRIQYIDFMNDSYERALVKLHTELRRKGVHLQLPTTAPPTSAAPPISPPQSTTPHPLHVSPEQIGAQYPQPQTQPPAPRSRPASSGGSRLPLVVAGVGVVTVIVVLALIALSNTPRDNGAQPTQDASVQASATPQAAVFPGLPGAAPITDNTQWQVVERTINGVPMVLVPAGSFRMGASDQQISYTVGLCDALFELSLCNNLMADEQPTQNISFERPFWIDKTEVSDGIYDGVSAENSFPRTNIEWNEAQAHCENRGGRLPSEAEWEYAARGPNNLIYPWGNEWDSSVVRANICDASCGENWRLEGYNDGHPAAAYVGS